jgi:hypothetical protein
MTEDKIKMPFDDEFALNIFSSQNQTVSDSLVLLGMDTEMLFKHRDPKSHRLKTIWPHEVGFPQEREPYNPKVSFPTELHSSIRSDFHGDGYAMELCIPPHYCLDVIMNRLGVALSTAKSLVGSSKLTIEMPAVYSIPKKDQEAAPDDVKRLGCSPSLNIYDDCGDPSYLSERMRTTGGHLHLTHPSLKTDKVAYDLVRWADILVGCTWVLVSPDEPKMEILRRKAYGRAGEFRYREYPVPTITVGATALEKRDYRHHTHGVEYRVLPGSVLSNPVYVSLMFNLYRTALYFAINYGTPPEQLSDKARFAINNMNNSTAEWVLSHIPFNHKSISFLSHLTSNPAEPLTPEEWKEAGIDGKGFRRHAESILSGVCKVPGCNNPSCGGM